MPISMATFSLGAQPMTRPSGALRSRSASNTAVAGDPG